MSASNESFRQFCERDSADRVACLVEINETLLDALEGVMRYASIGASVCDVDKNVQPEFVNARNAIRLAKGAL